MHGVVETIRASISELPLALGRRFADKLQQLVLPDAIKQVAQYPLLLPLLLLLLQLQLLLLVLLLLLLLLLRSGY
jgi:hypothetical protein